MKELEHIKSYIYFDECKFSVKDNDIDNTIFYFGVVVPKEERTSIENKYIELTKDLKKKFHAKDLYKAKKLNLFLMNDITNIFIKYRLHCLCFKYDKDLLYKKTKSLSYLDFNNERLKDSEYQAFFWLVQILEFYFKTYKMKGILFPAIAFFDRGVYGINDIEGKEIYSSFLSKVIFTKRSKINLLALPDHLGYIFKKCRVDFTQLNLQYFLNDYFVSLQ